MGISALPGIIGGGRGGAPKPGFTPSSAEFDFQNFDIPPELQEQISLAAEDPENRARRDAAATGLGQFGGEMMGTGQQFVGAGGEDLGGASGFYRSLLQGDPAARAEALAPEINAANRASQSAIDNIQRFGERGGGTNRALLNARIQRAGNVANIMSRARPMGAEGLIKTGTAMGELGLGAGRLGTTATATGADVDLGTADIDFNRARTESGLNLDRLGILTDARQGQAQIGLGQDQLRQQQASDLNRTMLGQSTLGENRRSGMAEAATSFGTGIADWLASRGGGGGKAGSVPEGTFTNTGLLRSGVNQATGAAAPGFSSGSSSFAFAQPQGKVSDQYRGGKRTAARQYAFA
jgi:hypothetical protein